jgi:glutamine synthetase
VNPYLATAAVVAAGLAGVEERLDLEPAYEGNAYDDPDAPRVPTNLAEALELWRGSEFARRTFGDDVVDHYANMAAVEVAAYERAVTDWERYRGFERL